MKGATGVRVGAWRRAVITVGALGVLAGCSSGSDSQTAPASEATATATAVVTGATASGAEAPEREEALAWDEAEEVQPDPEPVAGLGGLGLMKAGEGLEPEDGTRATGTRRLREASPPPPSSAPSPARVRANVDSRSEGDFGGAPYEAKPLLDGTAAREVLEEADRRVEAGQEVLAHAATKGQRSVAKEKRAKEQTAEAPPTSASGRAHGSATRGAGATEGYAQAALTSASQEDGRDWFAPPAATLPRMLYFENTYLGGDAGHLETLRRLSEALGGAHAPHRLAAALAPALDAPATAGLAVSAVASHGHIDRPQRVVLQVGLRGSDRYGWRRPPLDIALVVHRAAAHRADAAFEMASALLGRLGPQDRLLVIGAGTEEPEVVGGLLPPRRARPALAQRLDQRELADVGRLAPALDLATRQLSARAGEEGTVPGTSVVLLLTGPLSAAEAHAVAAQAHEATTAGVFTSLVELGEDDAEHGWRIAQAGYGNFHRLAEDQPAGEVVAAELDALSRVVARLIRVNVRLAPGVEAIRVLGSRVLDDEETRAVKAREVATDRQLSRALGIGADRGDDDDGIQTVIPYFYGGDSHALLLELWVTEPGPLAEVSVRYKDLVQLGNHTLHTAVGTSARPRPAGPQQVHVQQALDSAELGEALLRAAQRLDRGDRAGALRALAAGPEPTPADRGAKRALEGLLRSSRAHQDPHLVAQALRAAGERKLGAPAR